MKIFLLSFVTLFVSNALAIGLEDHSWEVPKEIRRHDSDGYDVPSSYIFKFTKSEVQIERTCHFTESQELRFGQDVTVKAVGKFSYTGRQMHFFKIEKVEERKHDSYGNWRYCSFRLPLDSVMDYSFDRQGNLLIQPDPVHPYKLVLKPN